MGVVAVVGAVVFVGVAGCGCGCECGWGWAARLECSLEKPTGSILSCDMASRARDVVHMSVQSTPTIEAMDVAVRRAASHGPLSSPALNAHKGTETGRWDPGLGAAHGILGRRAGGIRV